VPTPAKPAGTGNKAAGVSPLVSAFSGTERADPDGALQIKPGTLVRVKSQDEILSTLDRRAVCGGVSFIGEHMRQYCGSVFVVDKCIKCFYDEKDSCYAQLENTFALAGVYCGGRQPEGSRVCDRGCALFWKGEWLEPLANATAARPGRA
jgi:hypothetical protein